MSDPTGAEMLSIFALLFPCPPLPVFGATLTVDGERMDPDRMWSQMSSHDALVASLSSAVKRNDETANCLRAGIQKRLTARYMDQLEAALRKIDEGGRTKESINEGGEAVYACMCDFTRRYIQSYFPLAKHQTPVDVRFAPLSLCGPVVHRRVCEYMAARAMLDNDDDNKDDKKKEKKNKKNKEEKKAIDYAAMDLPALYLDCARVLCAGEREWKQEAANERNESGWNSKPMAGRLMLTMPAERTFGPDPPVA